MRHGLKRRTLGKKTTARLSMLKSQVEALAEKGKIRIPLVRARHVRSIIEKMITRAKTDSVANRRLLASKLINKDKVRLIIDLGKRYKDRPGGYTRIIKLGVRKGDSAKIALLELV